MRYTEIFDEIVDIMRNDSSTCKDIGAGDYEKYRSLADDAMSEKEFTRLVKRYIASLGVPAHINFSDSSIPGVNFEVMRYEDRLYVTRAAKESDFRKGDIITALDGKTIPEKAESEKEFLMGETDERQGFLWRAILTFAETAAVIRDGREMSVEIRSNGYTYAEEKYYVRDLGNNTLLLRLQDFGDEDAIRKVYADNREALEGCANLVIDVRGNGGGADTAFFPLLEYCFPEGREVEDYISEQYGMEINYSKRNCETRLEIMNSYLGEELPEEIRSMVEEMITEIRDNFGKGFVGYDSEERLGLKGRKKPERVFVITDEKCGSSGDAFVNLVSYSPKVTVVGRPTMGITDYSNCTSVSFDRFELMYPTSRDKRIDAGKGFLHKGVPVDKYIPWTPEHLNSDAELDYILSLTAN